MQNRNAESWQKKNLIKTDAGLEHSILNVLARLAQETGVSGIGLRVYSVSERELERVIMNLLWMCQEYTNNNRGHYQHLL
jgi:hypothetical protein